MLRDARCTAQRARRLRFQKLVQRLVRDLPADIQRLLEDVALVVLDEPTADMVDGFNDADGTLFGLYQGIPRTERTSGYNLVAPDRIILFAGPLTRACETQDDLRAEIRITVLHELGHHLGFDEVGLNEIGLA